MQMADLPYNLPDAHGHFGPYGGVFVAETLIRALGELKEQYARYQKDPAFVAEFERELATTWGGRRRSTTRALVRAPRRRADLVQARRPQPHRRA